MIAAGKETISSTRTTCDVAAGFNTNVVPPVIQTGALQEPNTEGVDGRHRRWLEQGRLGKQRLMSVNGLHQPF